MNNTRRLRIHSHAARQRGVGLIEALVAFLVLCLALLALSRLQGQLRLQAEIARQRSEAVRLAQQDLEQQRDFSALAPTAGVRAYADIASGTATFDGSTRFSLTRRVEDVAGARARHASTTVTWTDRAGDTQQVSLQSLIARSDPAHSGALALAPSGSPVSGPAARSIHVPLGAKDLGDGRSVFKPIEAGSVALVFDNHSGSVSARCNGIATGLATAALTRADLNGCETVSGLLLSGQVQFATGSAALPFAVSIVLAGASYARMPECSTEAATTGRGQPYAKYHCIVFPRADSGTWSGRVDLVPAGWTLGTGDGQWRVCRYAADLDRSGAIDRNIEHPAHYADVAGPLLHQNFLVLAAPQECPAGGSDGVHADLGTVQHQP